MPYGKSCRCFRTSEGCEDRQDTLRNERPRGLPRGRSFRCRSLRLLVQRFPREKARLGAANAELTTSATPGMNRCSSTRRSHSRAGARCRKYLSGAIPPGRGKCHAWTSPQSYPMAFTVSVTRLSSVSRLFSVRLLPLAFNGYLMFGENQNRCNGSP